MRYPVRMCCCLLLSVATLQQICPATPLFEMGASARAVALGGAFLAIADDESAIFYNPAGLAYVKEITFAAFYQRAFDVIHHLGISGMMRGWGFQFVQIGSGSFENTNEFGNSSGERTRYESWAGILGFALGGESLSLGGRARIWQDDSDVGLGLDVAGLMRLAKLRFGLMGESLFSSGNAPTNLRVGAAFAFRFSSQLGLTLAFDLWNLFIGPELHLGIEVDVRELRVRAGYDGVAFTSGAGVRWESVRIDWAYRMHPQLPASTVVTLAYLF